MVERKKLEVGAKAPAFMLPNQDGRDVNLSDLDGQWVVLYFYPKDDTPGCTVEACDFTAGIKQFEDLNANVLGVSPDSPESHQKFIKKHNLTIELLSDVDRKVLVTYGAWGTKKLYGRESEGVIRSTVLIDPNGKIAYYWPNVKAKGHAEQVRKKLAELAA